MIRKAVMKGLQVFLAIALIPLLANAAMQTSKEGGKLIMLSDGLPNHETGTFPNRANPNAITSQQLRFEVTLTPESNGRLTALGMYPFGVVLNGVPLDPAADEFWNDDRNSGWQYEPLSGKINLGTDSSNAHVQSNGVYHYHGVPWKYYQKNSVGSSSHSPLIGIAADGFPIYAAYAYADAKNSASAIKTLKSSYSLKQGTRPGGPGGSYDGTFVQDYEFVTGSGDLDQCNGRFGVTPEYPQGTYYYVITAEFPSIPRCFVGMPDNSFKTHGGTRQPGERPAARMNKNTNTNTNSGQDGGRARAGQGANRKGRPQRQ